MDPNSEKRAVTPSDVSRKLRVGSTGCSWLLLGCLAAGAADAGVYAGFQGNGEHNRIAYAGAVAMRGGAFYELFAARLEYRYDDGGTVFAEQYIVTPAVGMRWEDGWSIGLALGPSFVAREEEGTRTEDNDSIGLTLKASMLSAPGPLTHEVLTSYTTLDKVLWGRARIRRAVSSQLSLGGELIGMSAEQADSYGAGLVVEFARSPGRMGIVIGYERSTNREHTPYGGIELSAFF